MWCEDRKALVIIEVCLLAKFVGEGEGKCTVVNFRLSFLMKYRGG